MADRTVALFERLGQLASIAAASMKSDLEVARLMAAAGAKGALANVEINLDGITDAGYVTSMRERVASAARARGRSIPNLQRVGIRASPQSKGEADMMRTEKLRATGRSGRDASARKFVAACALGAMMLFSPKPARAGRLGADIIALFPKEVGEFAYADLKKARTMKWFPQLQEQMLPDRFRQFEKFLASAGVDPNTQVEELAWGLVAEGVTGKTEGVGSSAVPTGEQIVGVALGNYNPESHRSVFQDSRSCPTFKARNYTLVRVWHGCGRERSVLFLHRLEHRGVRASLAAGEND